MSIWAPSWRKERGTDQPWSSITKPSAAEIERFGRADLVEDIVTWYIPLDLLTEIQQLEEGVKNNMSLRATVTDIASWWYGINVHAMGRANSIKIGYMEKVQELMKQANAINNKPALSRLMLIEAQLEV